MRRPDLGNWKLERKRVKWQFHTGWSARVLISREDGHCLATRGVTLVSDWARSSGTQSGYVHGADRSKVNDGSDGTVFTGCYTYSRYFYEHVVVRWGDTWSCDVKSMAGLHNMIQRNAPLTRNCSKTGPVQGLWMRLASFSVVLFSISEPTRAIDKALQRRNAHANSIGVSHRAGQ